MNSKKLQEKAQTMYPEIRVDVYKGYCVSAMKYGWILRPFNGNEIFLGKNLRESFETLAMSEES